ncbi:hypothetical protein [Methylocapsa sp. S129]|uniref:hypothetical protein n=1 Tax=Methylocapsa sp. S129 TaxID=1641869 RepID=UPI00131BB89E|nr:hypothetical protein [Methylocapsa sp. S129]
MLAINVESQLDAGDRTHSRRRIETILATWDLLSWNELLADDIILSLRLGALNDSRPDESREFTCDLQESGRPQVKRMLKGACGDFRKNLSVAIEVIWGDSVILLGNLGLPGAHDAFESTPVAITMTFNSEGQIRQMTIAGFDLPALTDAIRSVGQVRVAYNS